MSIPIRSRLLCKSQASVATFISFRLSLLSKNDLTPKFSISYLPAEHRNPGHSLIIFQTLMYNKKNFQEIFKTILEAHVLPAYEQNWRTCEDFPKWALKHKALDVYKVGLYINCYNYIQQWKDYFAMSRFSGCNQVFFTALFLK